MKGIALIATICWFRINGNEEDDSGATGASTIRTKR